MPCISRCACGVLFSLPPWRPSMKPFYYYTYLLSFAEADSSCFCMYLSPQLFILSIHLEQAMAETTKKNHQRALPPTRRTLEGWWGTWPAWCGVNKQNTLCFQFAANPCASSFFIFILGGKGTRFESYISCYVAHLNHYACITLIFQTAIQHVM